MLVEDKKAICDKSLKIVKTLGSGQMVMLAEKLGNLQRCHDNANSQS